MQCCHSSVSSHVQLPCCIWKALSLSHGPLLALKSFCHLLPQRSMTLEEKSMVCPSLLVSVPDKLWASVLTVIYYTLGTQTNYRKTSIHIKIKISIPRQEKQLFLPWQAASEMCPPNTLLPSVHARFSDRSQSMFCLLKRSERCGEHLQMPFTCLVTGREACQPAEGGSSERAQGVRNGKNVFIYQSERRKA